MGLIAHVDGTRATVLRTGDACAYRVGAEGIAELVVQDESIARYAGQPMLSFPHRGGTTAFGHAPRPPGPPITVSLAPTDRLVLLDGRVLYQEGEATIREAIAARSIGEIVERLEASSVDPLERRWGIVVIGPAMASGVAWLHA
jgi:hypothetical protein